MKKVIVSSLIAIIIAMGCKTKKAATTSSLSTNISDAQLTAAKAKFPDITMETLNQGHSIYYGACTNCHGAKNITDYSETEFQSILDRMAPKADLNANQKDAVYKYATAVKLSAK